MHTFPPLTPKTILAVVAHPDDIEYGMGGTIAHYIAEGATVYYHILTNGNKGSEDRTLDCDQLRDLRRAEQRAAAEILGVKEVFFSDYEDGCLQVTLELKKDIVRTIRTLKPDIVMTMDPTMVYVPQENFINHPDHRAAGQATLDAVFPLARDHLSCPELDTTEQLEPHKVGTVLLVNLEKQNFFVDISATMDLKIKALAAHDSQMPDMPAIESRIRKWAQQTGAHSGYKYAESFMRIDID